MVFVQKLAAEQIDRFYAHLGTLPEGDRPVYGLVGLVPKSKSAWITGYRSSVGKVFMFHPDRVKVYTIRGLRHKKRSVQDYPLADITRVQVDKWPMDSNVTLHFLETLKEKISEVPHANAKPMEPFRTDGLAAFDRSRLDSGAVSGFYSACTLALGWPKEVIAEVVKGSAASGRAA